MTKSKTDDINVTVERQYEISIATHAGAPPIKLKLTEAEAGELFYALKDTLGIDE